MGSSVVKPGFGPGLPKSGRLLMRRVLIDNIVTELEKKKRPNNYMLYLSEFKLADYWVSWNLDTDFQFNL